MVRLLRSTTIGCAALLMTSIAAKADEYVTNLGPVGPNEPIIAAFGGARVIAFFVPERGSYLHVEGCRRRCTLQHLSRQSELAARRNGAL